MAAKTSEELFDLLSDELAWRRRELTYLRSLIESARTSNETRTVLLRAGVTLLYAHWEGFVRTAAAAYLQFVGLRRFRNRELTLNFQALAARRLLRAAGATDRIERHVAVASFFVNDGGQRSSIPYKDAVDTRSNLSSKVLKEIIDTLGLNYESYVGKEKLLDEGLLYPRNSVAHGEYLEFDVGTYVELESRVLEMMDILRTQIDNAASLRSYLVQG